MFQLNDDMSIYVTRGDVVFFALQADDNGKNYKFQPGEVLRIKVFAKKDAENVVLQKDFPVAAVTESVNIYLTKEETKIGEVISKPKDYWYEIELNPYDDDPQTIVGYDEDGPKVFKLFPEGDDVEDYTPPTPEEIPVVDNELDMTSLRPISNQSVARAYQELLKGYEATHAAVAKLHVTPEMFGAIGDGKADDTEALQNAINSGAVSLNGTYLINGKIDIPKGALIDGCYATVKCGKDAYFNVIGDNATIERMKLVGAGDDKYGINVAKGVKNTRISNIYGENIKYSLIMNDGENTLITGVYGYNCGWDCVSNYKNAKNSTIRDCFAVRCGRHGFSTDESADGIRFINCYAEDIGWIDGEGHTCFHLEGATNSKIINCQAVYTENHPVMSADFTGIFNACRIESTTGEMNNNSIAGLDIIYKEGFNSEDNQVFALYLHSASKNPPTIYVRDLYIKNNTEVQVYIYHGNILVHLDGFDITGNVLWKQQNASGYLLTMKNGNIYQGAKNQEFYYAQYCNKGMLCKNVIVTNSKGLMNGRFVDCVIENCVFEDCGYSVSMVQNASNSSEKSTGNTFRNNTLNNLDIGVVLGWWTGTGNNLIVNNVFKGAIGTLLSGSYAGCVFANNIDGGLTYTTATKNVTPVTDIPLVTI